jgi:hypothetical protein
VNGKYKSVKESLISSVERDVNEYAFARRSHAETLARAARPLCRGGLE